MATYKFTVEVKFNSVPEDYEDDVLRSIEDELDQANPGTLFYEDDNGNEKEREVKEWNVTRTYEEATA